VKNKESKKFKIKEYTAFRPLKSIEISFSPYKLFTDIKMQKSQKYWKSLNSSDEKQPHFVEFWFIEYNQKFLRTLIDFKEKKFIKLILK